MVQLIAKTVAINIRINNMCGEKEQEGESVTKEKWFEALPISEKRVWLEIIRQYNR